MKHERKFDPVIAMMFVRQDRRDLDEDPSYANAIKLQQSIRRHRSTVIRALELVRVNRED